MGIDLDELRTAGVTAGLDVLGAAQVKDLALRAFAPRTLESYRWCWSVVQGFADRHRIDALPMTSSNAALFAAWAFESGYSPETIRRFLGVVRSAHKMARAPDPTDDVAVRMVMRGAFRSWEGGKNRKDGVSPAQLAKMIDVARADRNRVQGVRDAAAMLCMWAWALRPDELHLARILDVVIDGDAAELVIPQSKGDRARRGQSVVMHRIGGPNCPVAMLERWMRRLPPGDGPLFRRVLKSGRIGTRPLDHSSIRRIVQRLAREAGIDADVAGHSMRIGWATTAFEAQLPDVEIMRHLRHAQIETSIGYNRSKRRPNLTQAVGL